MEIHKPKPWHGLREFLKEYAIIVVGVLTALAAEQAVEWLHWRHVAQEAETQLAAGMQPNLLVAAEFIADAPCQRLRLSQLSAALQQPSAAWHGMAAPAERMPGDVPRVTPTVYDAPSPIWSHGAWEAVVANGALAHLPRERVEKYAALYRFVDLAREREALMAFTYPQLTALAIDRTMTPDEKGRYLNVVAEIDQKEQFMIVLSEAILENAHRMKLDPAPDKLAALMTAMRALRGACLAPVIGR